MTTQAGMTTLPMELLHTIVSDQSLQLPDLLSCSLVCRTLWEAASTALYNHVDLRIFEDGDEDIGERGQRRQRQWLRSIHENPTLGARVRFFKNYDRPEDYRDVTRDAEPALLIRAAGNMKHLFKASLNANILAAHIITTLPSYKQLLSLTVFGLDPQKHIWDKAPTNLTSLDWRDFALDYRKSSLDSIRFLISVVEATCPALESLDVSEHWPSCYLHPDGLPTCSPERIQQYCNEQVSAKPTLTRLQHFGVRCRDPEIDSELLDFVRKHKQSLKSVSLPVCSDPWSKGRLEFVLSVCDTLPGLEALRLQDGRLNQEGDDMTASDFLRALTTNLASPKHSIERLWVDNIVCPFSPAIAQLFQPLTDLKFLRLGDADYESTEWAEDGRLDFEAYAPHILAFIKGLPASLEELYLDINGGGLCVGVDDDIDFDPVCAFGREIFTTLRRLHTCDIHAWILDPDGAMGDIPEKGVFYRRLPHQNVEESGSPANVQESSIKDVWTSRMNAVYQKRHTAVTAGCEVVELEAFKGGFEGKDATGIWCDGFTCDESGPEDDPDYSWPFFVDKVASYAMFRNNFTEGPGLR